MLKRWNRTEKETGIGQNNWLCIRANFFTKESFEWPFLLQMTEAEGQVPFAYSVLNHANIGLLEALLSAIFRPHNSYCIYIDAK